MDSDDMLSSGPPCELQDVVQTRLTAGTGQAHRTFALASLYHEQTLCNDLAHKEAVRRMGKNTGRLWSLL
jgi:hypothetical protein